MTYAAITGCYVAGFLLTLGVSAARHAAHLTARKSLLRDLREGLAYLWDTPSSLAALWLAFLVNYFGVNFFASSLHSYSGM